MGKRLIFRNQGPANASGKPPRAFDAFDDEDLDEAENPNSDPTTALTPGDVPDQSPSRVARDKLAKAEMDGALKIAQAWLDSFGELGRQCANTSFVWRMAVNVLRVMEKSWSPGGPRRYEISRHNKQLLNIPFDQENTLLMRYKAGFDVYHSHERYAYKIVIQPFDPAEYIRKPPHATHFRFMLAIGTMCDYDYDERLNCYVPVDATLEGVNNYAFSEMYPIHQPTTQDIELSTYLPGLPRMSLRNHLSAAVGIEFWHYGKKKVSPKLLNNAMMVIE